MGKICPEKKCPRFGNVDECSHGVLHEDVFGEDERGKFSVCDLSCYIDDEYGYMTKCEEILNV